MLSEKWYPRSCWREGIHFGQLDNDGVVRARCGVEFKPDKPLFGGAVAAAAIPAQAGQICRQCCDEAGIELEAVEDAPPNSHRRVQLEMVVGLAHRQPGATVLPPPLTPALSGAALLSPPALPILPVVAPPEQLPDEPAPTATRWCRKSTKAGDTHLVLSMNRGNRITACEVSFRGGKWLDGTPLGELRCPTCDNRRPR